MIFKSRRTALSITGLTIVGALVLSIDRGGVIALGALLLGAALLTKIWLKPSKFDLGLSIGLIAIPVLAWVGTFYYVISTWESGEVVELAIDTDSGTHKARLWVLDIGAHPVVYYDAEPEVADALLAGKPLQFSRAGKVSARIPKTTLADALPEDEAQSLLDAMADKYGDRNSAADIYYLMLGRSRDRVAVIATLIKE